MPPGAGRRTWPLQQLAGHALLPAPWPPAGPVPPLPGARSGRLPPSPFARSPQAGLCRRWYRFDSSYSSENSRRPRPCPLFERAARRLSPPELRSALVGSRRLSEFRRTSSFSTWAIAARWLPPRASMAAALALFFSASALWREPGKQLRKSANDFSVLVCQGVLPLARLDRAPKRSDLRLDLGCEFRAIGEQAVPSRPE